MVGAGAIGSVVGGLLARAGEEVWLLGRPWHLDRVREKGLFIRGFLGEHRVTSCHLAEGTHQLPALQWDVILVAVKSYSTEQAAELLPPLLSLSTKVVSLQNGLGNWEFLSRYVPPGQLVGGRVIFGVELKPGVATVTVWGGDILLGPVFSQMKGEEVEPIAQRLSAAGLPSRVTPTIKEALWSKVIYNSCLNPLSTLLEVPYGRLLETEETRRIMKQVAREAYEVAQAEKLELEPSSPDAYVEELFSRLIPATAAHHPSMLQDIHLGRRTEIDFLNGALVRLAAARRIPAPANEFLTGLIKAKENFSRLPGSHSEKEKITSSRREDGTDYRD